MRIITIVLLLALTACNSADDGVVDTREGTAEQSPAQSPDENGASIKTRQVDTLIMDGSSVESFEASLKQFQELAPASEYDKLKGAIQYLQLYDLGSRGNKAKLYQKLDGLTANEITALIKR